MKLDLQAVEAHRPGRNPSTLCSRSGPSGAPPPTRLLDLSPKQPSTQQQLPHPSTSAPPPSPLATMAGRRHEDSRPASPLLQSTAPLTASGGCDGTTSTGPEDRDPKARNQRRRLAGHTQGTEAQRIRRAPSTKRRRSYTTAPKHDGAEEKDQHHTPPLRRHLRLQDTAGWKPTYSMYRSGVPPPICRRHGLELGEALRHMTTLKPPVWTSSKQASYS